MSRRPTATSLASHADSSKASLAAVGCRLAVYRVAVSGLRLWVGISCAVAHLAQRNARHCREAEGLDGGLWEGLVRAKQLVASVWMGSAEAVAGSRRRGWRGVRVRDDGITPDTARRRQTILVRPYG